MRIGRKIYFKVTSRAWKVAREDNNNISKTAV